MKLKGLLSIIIMALGALVAEGAVMLFDGRAPVSFNRPQWKQRPVTEVAGEMLLVDIRDVTGMDPAIVPIEEARVKVVNLQTATGAELLMLKNAKVDLKGIEGKKDAFTLKAHKGDLYVAGADDRGTAYGMLEVSRLIGVSPWVFWNDATPERKNKITIADNYSTTQSPSVEYRGIFLNDEDWTLQPWSWRTFEPGQNPGTIGAKTYKEIFKLLLRLRANAIWPGMHGITTPFYFVQGAKETADSCGIAIGTSHCEPLMRNNVGEWKEKERGAYNYITNRENVINYWTERLKEAGKYENMYTIGMRGVHDGHMEGVNTMEEKVTALQSVLNDQRELLAKYVDRDVESIPQVFVPYKEVLDIMDHGLVVPDDVTLIWCDDNYGYMTRLSDEEQQKRKGGAGVYYHLSYWGRPHDYMWMGGTQPGLVYNEMREAYDRNARKVWIVNVHDMKTSSYPLELFLDMAWDIDGVDGSKLDEHLGAWLCREFGDEVGKELLPVMKEYYRLNAIRRPDHMGWTQVELSDRKAYPRGRSHVIDTEFSFSEFGSEADRYMDDYRAIADKVVEIEKCIPTDKKDNFFAQVKYPVESSKNMAVKMLEAQRARGYAIGQCDNTLWTRDSLMLAATARSLDAYQKIRSLTREFNDSLAGGKWKHAMVMNPRDLAVFNPPTVPIGLTEEEIKGYLHAPRPPKGGDEMPSAIITPPLGGWGACALNASEYASASFFPKPVSMLGHSQMAVPIPQGESITYEMNLDHDGPTLLTTALIPTQPNDTGDIRVAISVDGGEPIAVSYKEQGRTDTWKENVLRNQVRIKLPLELKAGRHTVTVRALDTHVILDQIMLDSKPQRKYYVIPAGI